MPPSTTIQSRLVSGARAGCKVMINATYGRKMQPAMHAAARRLTLIAPRRKVGPNAKTRQKLN